MGRASSTGRWGRQCLVSTDVFPGMSDHCQILVSCPPHGNDKRAKHLISIESDGHDKAVIDCSLLARRVERMSGSVECLREAAELAECQVQCKQLLSGPSDTAIWRTTESSRYCIVCETTSGGARLFCPGTQIAPPIVLQHEDARKRQRKSTCRCPRLIITVLFHGACSALSAQSVPLVPCGRWRD